MPREADALARRAFLRSAAVRGTALAAAAGWAPGVFAEQLLQTPSATEGPFFPDRLPLDTDNDLLVINDSTSPAVGTVAHVTGRVLDAAGEPMRNALVEVWQADANGVYLHSRSDRGDRRDAHFQGYGRFLTDRAGRYYFRTIKPVAYGPRTPHIHFKVSRGDRSLLTTQLYTAGEAQNQRDGLYRRLGTVERQQACTTPYEPVEGSRIGEVQTKWDIVLGVTPEEPA